MGFFHCSVLCFFYLLTSSTLTFRTGDKDIAMDVFAAEFQTLKNKMSDIEGQMEIFTSLYTMNLDKKVTAMESNIKKMSEKVDALYNHVLAKDTTDKSPDQLTTSFRRIAQRLEKLLEQPEKKSQTDLRENESRLRIHRIEENIYGLFQIFSALNIKVDSCYRVAKEREKCIDRESLETWLKDFMVPNRTACKDDTDTEKDLGGDKMDLFVEKISQKVENVIEKLPPEKVINVEDITNIVIKSLEGYVELLLSKTQNCSLVSRMDKLLGVLETSIGTSEVKSPRIQSPSSSPKDQALADEGRDYEDEEIQGDKEPGKIFRRFWRKLTEPVTELNKKIEAIEMNFLDNVRLLHNQTMTTLMQWFAKQSWAAAKPCIDKVQVIVEVAEALNEKLRHLKSSQDSTADTCSAIHSEVQYVRRLLETRYTVDKTVDLTTTGQNKVDHTPQDCSDLQMNGAMQNGIYMVRPSGVENEFPVYCDLRTDGGGWTVIQRRGDFGEPRQNFTEDWETYKDGFGDPLQEFWIGNEKIYLLTTAKEMKLRIELHDFDNNYAIAEYNRFHVSDEINNYKLSVSGYRGNASDSLTLHDGKMFSTIDRDNDEVESCCNCADTFKGGWWYYRCFEANLNGPYQTKPTENGYFLGIIWEQWRGDYSLKGSEMKIRPLMFDEIKDP
ncbi:uncharacterized protein LOC143255187 [Tachypleus tridentatus]|uniref:uncharacterized protein LOC143255187 n=1 Tax=Tachypleus tridentatus TaxID=6853 RepID=UPI003FD0AE60